MIITGSRGEYGYIRPLLREIEARPELDYLMVATNMHLLPEFGSSVNFMEQDGFKVSHEFYMALDGYTNTSMCKSLAVFFLSISDAIHNDRPDVILLAGDRGEQLMAAIAGAHMNIPVAHIQAGEVSGNIDGLTRHAIARYAHIHFAANADAAQRLVRSGEQEFRVHRVGAPQLDEFLSNHALPTNEVAERFHLDEDKPSLLVLQHSVTEQPEQASRQMHTTLKAISDLGIQTVLIFPNNDAGSSSIRRTINEFRAPWLHVERSVSREYYRGLMSMASAMVGNSSSGILEAPSFELPAVNIGRRQEGRVQGRNVINVDHDEQAIQDAVKRALDPEFKRSLRGMENPYGDGRASKRIIEILADLKIDERLMFKALTY
jgi:GDP/UDP-N,N'-diacetylbacillosamine 2-epimerase (hydrolysing)